MKNGIPWLLFFLSKYKTEKNVSNENFQTIFSCLWKCVITAESKQSKVSLFDVFLFNKQYLKSLFNWKRKKKCIFFCNHIFITPHYTQKNSKHSILLKKKYRFHCKNRRSLIDYNEKGFTLLFYIFLLFNILCRRQNIFFSLLTLKH